MLSMAGFWNWWLDRLGLGATQEEQLDHAAAQMSRDVELKKELAAKTVALARAKHRELAEAVARHDALEQAAVRLQQANRPDVVQQIAVELAESQASVETLTQELQDLNASASEAVEGFRQERDDSAQLLRQHGRLKAVADMNRQLETLRAEMKALAGASTARGAYKAIASEIEVKAQEHRAIAQLESGDATRKAQVTQALTKVRVQEIIQAIEAKAREALPGATISVSLLDQARAALDFDPVKGALPAPAAEEEVEVQEEVSDEEET
jgi:hypothetical protein